MPTRREFILSLSATALGAALTGSLAIIGCGAKSTGNTSNGGGSDESAEEAAPYSAATDAPAPLVTDAFSEDEGGAYTSEKPGDYAGKVGSHQPTLDTSGEHAGGFSVEGDMTTVYVSVNHGMDADKPHWIQAVYVKSATGALLDAKYFPMSSAGQWPAEKPLRVALTFKTADAAGAVTLFERCNLHGLWRNDVALG